MREVDYLPTTACPEVFYSSHQHSDFFFLFLPKKFRLTQTLPKLYSLILPRAHQLINHVIISLLACVLGDDHKWKAQTTTGDAHDHL